MPDDLNTYQYWEQYFSVLLLQKVHQNMISAGWVQILFTKEAIPLSHISVDYRNTNSLKPQTYINLYTQTETLNHSYLFRDGTSVGALKDLPEEQREAILNKTVSHWEEFSTLMALCWTIDFLYEYNDAIYFTRNLETNEISIEVVEWST